jgi:hypothetical protein
LRFNFKLFGARILFNFLVNFFENQTAKNARRRSVIESSQELLTNCYFVAFGALKKKCVDWKVFVVFYAGQIWRVGACPFVKIFKDGLFRKTFG